MFKLALAISIVCLQSLSISAEEKGIQLGWLTSGELVNWGQCNRDSEWMQYGGAFAHSYYVVHSESSAKCMSDNWVVNWDEEDLGKSQNKTDCLPVSESNQIGNCKTCPCIGSSSLTGPGNILGLNRFSLRAQESDVANNKVITGVRFVSGARAIYMEIQEATLQENREVKDAKWVTVSVKQNEDYEVGKTEVEADEFLIAGQNRSVHLDKIILPSNFFITGVRFAPIPSGKGVQLEIRGTTEDSNGDLDAKSHVWVNSARMNDPSYYRQREEINLKNAKDSPLASENKEITTTNHFVRFRAAPINEKMIFPTIPRLSTASAETMDNTPPQGIQLSYAGQQGYGGYLILKTIPMTYIELPGSNS